MKKLSILFIILLFPFNVMAKGLDTEKVTLDKCVDGDTAWFIMDKERIKVRFLAIDTPETVHPTKDTELYGKDASEFTCNMLTNAEIIELEFDPKSTKTDKYGRYLAWIFVDDILLQDKLIKIGYAKVAYLYGNYIYTEQLQLSEEKAKEDKLGLWNDEIVIEEIDKEEEKEESKGLLELILDFLNEILTKLLEMIDNLIENVL